MLQSRTILSLLINATCGDSVVSIGTCYKLDGLGIESQWRWGFPHQSRIALGPTQLPRQWVWGHSRW